jgi:hypothetical protein
MTSTQKPSQQPTPAPPDDDLASRLDGPTPETITLTNPGDSFVGTFLGLTTGRSKYGERPILLLADTNGQPRRIWVLHRVFWGELNKLRPAPGERIGIRYLGRQENRRGDDSYHAYEVVTDRGVTWDDASHAFRQPSDDTGD